MPVSKKRDKNVYKVPRNFGKDPGTNPKWLVPTAITLLVAGLLWIVIYYVSAGQWPAPISFWNIIIGFVLMASGMVVLTRWK